MDEPSATAARGTQSTATSAASGAENPWTRIKEHKVLQWSLAYLGGALALAHGQELVSHAFDWPEVVSRITIGVLAVGFPLAIVLAWYHGHRGMRRTSQGEMTVVSVLLVIAAVLLMALVRVPEKRAVESSDRASPQSSAVPSSTISASSSASASSAAITTTKPRLAILPFENLSPDPKNAFFTDGMHEEIIATLSEHAPGIEVISRTTMMMYRSVPKPVEAIARELGATHVLEGSVRREGSEVRLTLQLINARTDDHLWAHDYDRTLKSALTLQSDVADEVASQLSARLASRAQEFKSPAHDPEAYDLYLKAMLAAESLSGPATPLETLQRMEGLLDAALVRDPSFGLAHALRAGTRNTQFVFNYDIGGHTLPLTRADLEAAERLAPLDPMVIEIKGLYLFNVDHNLDGALAAYAAADAAGLVNPVAMSVEAEALMLAGRLDEARQHVEHARALDPKNPFVMAELASVLLASRRPAEARRVLDFAAAEFPVPFQELKSDAIWRYTGSPRALSSLLNTIPRPEISATTDVSSLKRELEPLRIQHRYAQIAALLDRARTKTIRSYFGAAADHPVAELKGWTHLLLGNQAAAVQDGREVLDFVAQRSETQWNRAYLQLLRAEGNLFMGQMGRAIAAASETLQVAHFPASKMFVTPTVASVYAWAGAQDEAAVLLEQLSTELPMTLAPAEIARDPLYNVPLAGNSHYQSLKSKLEAQMASMKLE